MTFADLQQALAIFGLAERATVREIKARHRDLVKRFHPDRGEKHDPERIRMINAAYAVLRTYCDQYRFSFAEEEFYEQNPEERLRRQFVGDPIWGGGD
jgi:curved DNA-binding protein CbpA